MASRAPGVYMVLGALLGGLGWVTAERLGLPRRVEARLFPNRKAKVALSAGDFPAGVAAPVGDIASLPLRPVRIGFVPNGGSAALLWCTGGAHLRAEPAPQTTQKPGLFKTAYALDAEAWAFDREEDLVSALSLGGERGGVDLAVLQVDVLAQEAEKLRDAAPRTLLLVGRSRGEQALAAVGVADLGGLAGKRIAAASYSSGYYFLLWLLSRAGLSASDVHWVDLRSSFEAGKALREGRADAVVGSFGDVSAAAKERGGKVLATTTDAPHLISSVLVSRGDFAARYPDAIRRALRGLLDAASATSKDEDGAARLLGDLAPQLGDPLEAVRAAPGATLEDNLAFFGLSGEAPVTYDELFESAAELYRKLGRIKSAPSAEDTRELGALRYVAGTRAR